MKKLTLRLSLDIREAFFDALSNISLDALTLSEDESSGTSNEIGIDQLPIANYFYLTAYDRDQKNIDQALIMIDLMSMALKIDLDSPVVEQVQDKDWVKEYYKDLKPLVEPPFYIFGKEEDRPHQPENHIPIFINASRAFGSGDHETTSSCLKALNMLKGKDFSTSNILDMGCGSGILGIASHYLWPDAALTFVDSDEEAVKLAQENIKDNDIQVSPILYQSLGFQKTDIADNGPYNLILANILAKPLVMMAQDMAKNLTENGHVILSGLLKTQENMVKDVYQNAGFTLCHTIHKNDWSTLILKK